MARTALQDDLQLVQRIGHGLILRSVADEVGISAKVVRRLERDGTVLRLGTGVHVRRDTFEIADPWGRFAFRSRAWAVIGSTDAHACDFSAAAVLGLPMWGDPPEQPRVIRPGSAHRGHSRTPTGRIRYGWLPPAHQWTFGGASVTSAAYACIDVIRMGSLLQGLTIADYAMAIGVSREQLGQIARDLRLYKGIERVDWIIGHADGRSESPLETAGRLVCLTYELPPVVANPWIVGCRTPRRVDLPLPDHGIILEADGALKYDNRPDAARIVADQGDRELELRDLGYEVLRFDARLALSQPGRMVAGIRRLMARRKGTSAPTGWSVEAPDGWPRGLTLGAGWPVPEFARPVLLEP